MTPGAAAFAEVPTEEVPCPLCGAAGGRLLSVQHGRFGVVKCGRCRLVRLSPRPTRAAAQALYGENYYAAGGYDDYVATFERYRPIYEKLFARRLALLRRHLPGPGSIVECGSAHGFQLDWVRRKGWDVVGTDVSPHAAAYARERFGLDVIEGLLEETPLGIACFDAAYLVDLIEHLYDPAAALARVARALRPGGVMLAQSPYELYHWEKLGQAWREKKRPGGIAPDAVPYHVMFFTPRTLRLMLERCGFRVVARYSGTYGAIRQRLAPPRLRGDTFAETAERFIYYKSGLRAAFQAAARLFKQGSGIIYIATPRP